MRRMLAVVSSRILSIEARCLLTFAERTVMVRSLDIEGGTCGGSVGRFVENDACDVLKGLSLSDQFGKPWVRQLFRAGVKVRVDVIGG
jgi:hypothetical protein